jgi:hypothetical protein
MPASPAALVSPVLAGGVWEDQLDTTGAAEVPWLWHGYLAAGSVTLLTSRWKAGKTTLLSVLLARRATGSPLAGRPLTAGKTAVVSEESRAHWSLRRRRLGFGHRAWFLCRPFRGKPGPAEWLALIDGLAAMGPRDGVDLVVLDPLACFLPGRDESQAALMLEALAPLQRLTEQGMAVLLLHHPKKGEAAEGEAARGSGALSGFADIVVEMSCRGLQSSGDRRRTLRGFSRYEETPRELVIELNPEGTDYAALGDVRGEEFKESWERVRAVLADATGKLTRREICDRWPDGRPPPESTLRRWLDEATGHGWVCADGLGSKEFPLRYWLPGREEVFRAASPLYEVLEHDRAAREQLARRDRAGPGRAALA